MPIDNLKITGYRDGVRKLSDRPSDDGITADELKRFFDSRTDNEVKTQFNALIEALAALSGASEIGAAVDGAVGRDVQSVLDSLVTLIRERYTIDEANTLVDEETHDLVGRVDIDLTTGVLTVTKKDGTVQTWDTPLEKVPATFELEETGGTVWLVITNVDGSSTRTEVTALMNIYRFDASPEVAFAVMGEGNEKRVSASIRPASVGIDKLSLSATSYIESMVARSETASANADTLAQSAAGYSDSARRDADRAQANADAGGQSAAASAGSAQSAGTSAGAAASSAANALISEQNAAESARKAKESEVKAAEIVGGDFATRTEMNTALAGKSNTGHTHTSDELLSVVAEHVWHGSERVSGVLDGLSKDVAAMPDYVTQQIDDAVEKLNTSAVDFGIF